MGIAMRQLIQALVAIAVCANASLATAMEYEEYVNLKNAIIELCRGGTLTGEERITEAVTGDRVLEVRLGEAFG